MDDNIDLRNRRHKVYGVVLPFGWVLVFSLAELPCGGYWTLVRKDKVERYDGCTQCYGSGVVGLSSGNRHFREGEIYHICPRGCKLTEFGRGKLIRS